MKIASRFPIKANASLLVLLIIGHLLVLVTGLTYLSTLSAMLLVLVVTGFSFSNSYSQYLKVTQNSDDLCWSGENWLVHDDDLQGNICYLELLDTSWITAEFSLLKFDNTSEQFAWLFTRNSLGERLYSELCYLTRLNLKRNTVDDS